MTPADRAEEKGLKLKHTAVSSAPNEKKKYPLCFLQSEDIEEKLKKRRKKSFIVEPCLCTAEVKDQQKEREGHGGIKRRNTPSFLTLLHAPLLNYWHKPSAPSLFSFGTREREREREIHLFGTELFFV